MKYEDPGPGYFLAAAASIAILFGVYGFAHTYLDQYGALGDLASFSLGMLALTLLATTVNLAAQGRYRLLRMGIVVSSTTAICTLYALNTTPDPTTPTGAFTHVLAFWPWVIQDPVRILLTIPPCIWIVHLIRTGPHYGGEHA